MTPEAQTEAHDFADGSFDEQADEQLGALHLPAERRLVTQPYDLSVKGLTSDIDSGSLILGVEYQRRFVWDNTKASRLVESLLLNVPIPVLYFAEDDSGRHEVIDGLQRLTTLQRFMNGQFSLSGLTVLDELNGRPIDGLDPRDRRRLENRTIRCIVITEDSNPDIKFDVFERLNTGSAQLTNQELRNAIYRGELNESLKELAQAEEFTSILGNSRNTRMELEELVLRFFALRDGTEDYRPPLRQFLNVFMRGNRTMSLGDEQRRVFQETCQVVGQVLGANPYRTPGGTAVNRAFFDAIMIPFAAADHAQLRQRAPEVRDAVLGLFENEDFVKSIGRATADKQRLISRISKVAEALRTSGVEVGPLPASVSAD